MTELFMSIITQRPNIWPPSATIVEGEFALGATPVDHRAERRGIKPALGEILRFWGSYKSLIALRESVFL